MRRPDRHNEIELNLLRTGTLTYLLGGRRVTVPEGGLSAFWAAIPHQIIESSGEPEYYVATLPLAWFLECRLPKKLVDRLLHGEVLRDPEPQRFQLDLHLFKLWIQDFSGKSAEPGPAILLELHARLLRMADSIPDLDHQDQEPGNQALLGTGGIGKMEQLAAHIAKHYQEPILIKEVAEKLGLHPNYAMNLFKKTFNLTINEYLTQHRLFNAQRLLATTDQKIIDVALDSGYPTLSWFNEAFKKSCGCSPSEYRRQNRIDT